MLRLWPSSPMCSASASSARRSIPCSDFQGVRQDRPHGLVHPAQLGQHFLAVGAVAQHLAVAFVEVGIGLVAVGQVLDDVDLHRGGDHPGHRADRRVMVAGLELRPRRSPPWLRRRPHPPPAPRRSARRSPPRAAGRTSAPSRSAGRRAGSGSGCMPGMTSRAVASPLSTGRASIMRSTAAALAASMSTLMPWPSSSPAAPSSVRRRRRRPPVDLHRPGALGQQAFVEELEADVDRRHLRPGARPVRPAAEIRATGCAARAPGPLRSLRRRTAPACSSRWRCCGSPCGSSSVPTRSTTTSTLRCRSASEMAGAHSEAGSGCAPSPNTTSISISATSGSAASWRNRLSRRSLSSIGCRRPTVNSSSPRSRS